MAGDRRDGLHRSHLGSALGKVGVKSHLLVAEELTCCNTNRSILFTSLQINNHLDQSSVLSLVDCFLVSMAPVSVSFSPTGDFLATSHIDSLGIYLWSGPITAHCFFKIYFFDDDITIIN